ncbi:NifB/NifX family molybdenum-iron cluster-binding protein [Methanocella sp. MCL-LM]|uniref:NifB/NifX family molybdenum-iron cluster-binding protein n=1 Tax=Methanocella sp. MCL-LM TaxID=3412035 RepID=UPI003C765B2B
MVKVAIPVESANGMLSELSDHFGMAEDFAVFEYDHGEVGDLRFIHNDPDRKPEPKTNAQFLADEDVKMVLAGFIGPHMLTVLLGEGIRVYKGAVGTLEDVLEDFKADMLTEVHTPGEMLD